MPTYIVKIEHTVIETIEVEADTKEAAREAVTEVSHEGDKEWVDSSVLSVEGKDEDDE